jgi:hypothetical protein
MLPNSFGSFCSPFEELSLKHIQFDISTRVDFECDGHERMLDGFEHFLKVLHM